jgi:aryl-alcohol dehydrogenase-like predicted oxidoreductase
VRDLKEVADGVGLTRAQLALAWVLRHTQMSCAITGATKPSQIEESLGAAGVDLPEDVLTRIDEILG